MFFEVFGYNRYRTFDILSFFAASLDVQTTDDMIPGYSSLLETRVNFNQPGRIPSYSSLLETRVNFNKPGRIPSYSSLLETRVNFNKPGRIQLLQSTGDKGQLQQAR